MRNIWTLKSVFDACRAEILTIFSNKNDEQKKKKKKEKKEIKYTVTEKKMFGIDQVKWRKAKQPLSHGQTLRTF